MRVLVTGAGGLLGGRLAQLLHESGFTVIAAHRRTPPPAGPEAVAVDLDDDTAVSRLLDATQPRAVLHAAVLGRADECQERPAEADRVNAWLPGAVAGQCRARGVRLVALSTDLVFPGTQPFSDETTEPRPLGVYGRTKRAGERAVLAACPSAAVARVALVVGRGHGVRGTASESVGWALRSGRPLQLFVDEFRTPVDAESVADACARLLNSSGSGLFHLGGPERLSRYELGARVARLLEVSDAAITAARQADYPGADPRPADVSLDSGRARRELGWQPRPLEKALLDGRPTSP